MCLAIPMKLVAIDGTQGVVEIGGVKRKADLSLVAGAEVGHYVVVHAGFAISLLNEIEAQKNLELIHEMARMVEASDQASEGSGRSDSGPSDP